MVCILQNDSGDGRVLLYFYDAEHNKFYGCVIYRPIYPLELEHVYLEEIFGGNSDLRTSIYVEKLDEKYKLYKAVFDLKYLQNIVDEILYDKI